MTTQRSFAATFCFILGSFVGLPVADSAPLLSLDFGSSASTPAGVANAAQAGFSPFTITNNNASTTLPFNAGANNVTVYEVVPANTAIEGRLRVNPAADNPPNFTLSGLIKDFLIANETAAGAGLGVTIDGLTPGANYTVTVWSYDSNLTGDVGTNIRRSDWSYNGTLLQDDHVLKGPLPTFDADYSFTHIVAADINGLIDIEAIRDASSNSGSVNINGLQITAVPEPSSLALLALGMLSLIARRRNRR